MTRRLELLYSLIKPGKGFADIGTDHGYIPIQLALENYPGQIFASDINRGPLESAGRNALESGVEEKIEFILADGLSGIDRTKIDTILIAGMGGDLICTILDKAEWVLSPEYHLILQPMTKPEVLRYWLLHNGFSIDCDIPVKDFGKLYSVISARFTDRNSCTSDAEYFTGDFDLIKNNEFCGELLEQYISRILKISVGLKLCDTPQYRMDFYDAILNRLIAMKEML